MRAPLDLTIFLGYAFLQPRSFEGAAGARTKAERGAAPAPSCLASTGPGRHGDPPRGTMTPRVYRYAMTAAFERNCSKAFRSANARSAVNAKCDPETGNRRAERRRAQRPSPRDAHARQGVHTAGGANRRSAPSIFEGKHPPCHGGENETAIRGADQGRGGFRMAV